MIYNIYRQKSKFYIVDSNGKILKDNVEQVRVTRETTSSDLFEFFSDDLGRIEIHVNNIRTKSGLPFSSSNAFEYWCDRNTGEHAQDENDLGNYASQLILESFGHVVSIEEKSKTLGKFGRNENVGTSFSTLWFTGKDQANEILPADDTNPIDSISCSTSDTQKVNIEGHTMSGGKKYFIVQSKTLQGQTRLDLDTPLNRVTRIEHADESETDLTGEVYCYQNTAISSGKPTDTTKIHITLPAGENKTQKASTSLSDQDYWIITSISAGYLTKTGSNTAQVNIQFKEKGGVFKNVAKPLVMATGDSDSRNFEIPLIGKPNSDIRLVGKSSTTGQSLTGDIFGYLAKIIL